MVLITNRIEKTLAQSAERAESTGIYHRTMSGAKMAEHGEAHPARVLIHESPALSSLCSSCQQPHQCVPVGQ